jgi:hypothetical protein
MRRSRVRLSVAPFFIFFYFCFGFSFLLLCCCFGLSVAPFGKSSFNSNRRAGSPTWVTKKSRMDLVVLCSGPVRSGSPTLSGENETYGKKIKPAAGEKEKQGGSGGGVPPPGTEGLGTIHQRQSHKIKNQADSLTDASIATLRGCYGFGTLRA